MTDKEKKLRHIINDFEHHNIGEDAAIEHIRELTGETIDIRYLSEYWSSESLDTFVEKLLIEHITDWHAINDERAIALIDEIKNNVCNEVVISRNSAALEKRYGKPSGTVIEKIFCNDMKDSKELLEELKRTGIFL